MNPQNSISEVMSYNVIISCDCYDALVDKVRKNFFDYFLIIVQNIMLSFINPIIILRNEIVFVTIIFRNVTFL